MKKTSILLIIIVAGITTHAQIHMRIYHKEGGHSDVPIEQIDSITFVNSDEALTEEMELTGNWLWGSKEKGYYEVLSFNKGRTYTGYDYYLEYGFDTWTYGTYMVNGLLLNLWSYGYGYCRTYRWYIIGCTENALEVMTQMGRFTYYRVQSEVYSLKIGEESYTCGDGDFYVFTDGVKILDKGGVLKGIGEGTTYILKYNAESKLIMAYKVVIY
jgi:hypothetical protein